ncbi:MAG: YlmC/YmxH family sporulation protein, partial [Oscillospiraceae bacterium]|nr:YlmC/YmxH family sporulation protein [Oscillospiraceae bacterium]
MEKRIRQLRGRHVVDIHSGSGYGRVGDLEIDLESGAIRALLVPGRRWWFGLKRERDRVFPWDAVQCFGEDFILVDGTRERPPAQGRAGRFSP